MFWDGFSSDDHVLNLPSEADRLMVAQAWLMHDAARYKFHFVHNRDQMGEGHVPFDCFTSS